MTTRVVILNGGVRAQVPQGGTSPIVLISFLFETVTGVFPPPARIDLGKGMWIDQVPGITTKENADLICSFMEGKWY